MLFNECLRYTVPTSASDTVWQNLGKGKAFVTREGGKPFIFATSQEATIKADAERLQDYPEIISQLLQLYATHPCIISADVLSFVPNGTADFTDQLAQLTGKPIIRLVRPKGAPRDDIRFRDSEAQALAKETKTVCLVEDISRTGFSAYVTAKMLRSINPNMDIHSLSMLQRGPVEERYQEGRGAIAYHTFVRRDLPLDVDEFRQQFPTIPVHVVA